MLSEIDIHSRCDDCLHGLRAGFAINNRACLSAFICLCEEEAVDKTTAVEQTAIALCLDDAPRLTRGICRLLLEWFSEVE